MSPLKLDERIRQAHNADMRYAAMMVAGLALLGCSDSKAEQSRADQAAVEAVQKVVCATDREELGFALADFADAAEAMDPETRQDAIWNMTDEAKCPGAATAR